MNKVLVSADHSDIIQLPRNFSEYRKYTSKEITLLRTTVNKTDLKYKFVFWKPQQSHHCYSKSTVYLKVMLVGNSNIILAGKKKKKASY